MKIEVSKAEFEFILLCDDVRKILRTLQLESNEEFRTRLYYQFGLGTNTFGYTYEGELKQDSLLRKALIDCLIVKK